MDEILARARAWQEHRQVMFDREAEGYEPHPDELHASDDEAVEIVHALLRLA
jgi:hypothetical protein